MLLTSLLNSLPGAVTQGLIWGLMAIGVYVTFRILDVADLTVDGTMALGGAVCVMLIRGGMNPWLAMLCAFIAGACAGLVTGELHTRCGIPAILAGILTQLALYSVNLRVMGGKANQAVSVDKYGIIVSQRFVRELSFRNPMPLLIVITAVLIVIMYWFFGTEIGSAVRATGCNEKMAKAQGINTDRTKYIALMMSNGLAALSGALIAQYNFSADVNMATGTIVIGLASVVIGELIVGNRFSFWVKLLGVVLGSVIYRLIFTVAVGLGMNTNDLKLIASIIIVITLCVPTIKAKIAGRKKNART